MRKLDDRTTDVVTTAHKLIGFAWVISTALVLGLVILGMRSGEIDWVRVARYDRVGSIVSVITLGFGVVYTLFTSYGVKNGWVLGKWALYLVAVGVSGYAITAAREGEAVTVIVLASVELAALLAMMGIGVYLERSRHAGK